MTQGKSRTNKKVGEKQSPGYTAGSVKTTGKPGTAVIDEAGPKKVTREVPEAKKTINDLQKANSSLLGCVKSLEERLSVIETTLPVEKVIILREISRGDAKKEICNLFSKGKTLYYSDIAERLNLDLKQVVDICNELQKCGEIQIDDNALQSR